MGQKPSHQAGGRFLQDKLRFLFPKEYRTTHNPRPEQPIKFQYKTTRKTVDKNQQNEKLPPVIKIQTINNLKTCVQVKNTNETKDSKPDQRNVAKQYLPMRTKSEPTLAVDKVRTRNRQKKKTAKSKNNWKEKVQQFGYEIQDVDAFLAKATLEKPANIPIVLAFPSVLYQTRVGGYQAEISLPLGMVVNAVFKNQHWLYVQTPHAEEGYVSYAACLPLGIIPPPDDDTPSPCWEKSTDVFPKPSGNMTDTEKLSSKSDCSGDRDNYCRAGYRTALSTCGEKSVDRLYLRAAAIAKGRGTRQTLLVINEDYKGVGQSGISVMKNEVVFLLNANFKGWFYVKNKDGREGFIPSAVAGHGFL
ncbi:uncharacterized protein LOC132703579 [Cylas formicarius]|uniref:uncharacterized protein LOC132703579 n=1 Tax=Cylas formicarius TaxID=197179 RepID=UPI002958D4F2|nr:uncharacterized protein LOC132703579 [Cylas formicarius]